MESLSKRDIGTASSEGFVPPSVDREQLCRGSSYTYHSPVPKAITSDRSVECVLGIDEAGRGPVLGPMVYGLLYLPLSLHHPLLAAKYHFDDSKVLSLAVRTDLVQTLCTKGNDLESSAGWATRIMSARDISAGMLMPTVAYNLNNQAMDATIGLIQEVMARGVNVKEIYIDTIGHPGVYQQKLERVFPSIAITVAKKADSLYPCVSAASVCAKVTRDAALETLYQEFTGNDAARSDGEGGWGSGYPSDSRCISWLKQSRNPLFGWGNECRFSWGTAKDLQETHTGSIKVDWPKQEDDHSQSLDLMVQTSRESSEEGLNKLAAWYGVPTTQIEL